MYIYIYIHTYQYFQSCPWQLLYISSDFPNNFGGKDGSLKKWLAGRLHQVSLGHVAGKSTNEMGGFKRNIRYSLVGGLEHSIYLMEHGYISEK